nr:hypothetical protein [Burkholderia cenocepacia]
MIDQSKTDCLPEVCQSLAQFATACTPSWKPFQRVLHNQGKRECDSPCALAFARTGIQTLPPFSWCLTETLTKAAAEMRGTGEPTPPRHFFDSKSMSVRSTEDLMCAVESLAP